MREEVRAALDRAATFAVRLAADQPDAEDARRDLAALFDGLAGVRGRLVVTTGPSDGLREYDLLVTHEAGTHTLAFAPAGSRPWPLRGARSPTEQDVVRVNGTVLRMQRAMAWLDGLWERPRLLRHLVDLCLVEEEWAERGGAVDAVIDDALLQRRMDEFRLRRGLTGAADTHRWLAEHGMTHRVLEEFVLGQLRFEVLREQVTRDAVEAELRRSPGCLDTLAVALAVFAEPGLCAAVHAHCADGRAPLEEAAGRTARAAARSRPFGTAGQAVRLVFRDQVRRSATAPVAALFANSVPEGTVSAPHRHDGGYAVAQKLAPAVRGPTDRAARAQLRDAAFERWLAERRRDADVEWYWGRARPEHR